MVKDKLLRIASQGAQIIADRFVATMNGRIERRIMYVYPIVFAVFVQRLDLCVIGETESVGIALGRIVGI